MAPCRSPACIPLAVSSKPHTCGCEVLLAVAWDSLLALENRSEQHRTDAAAEPSRAIGHARRQFFSEVSLSQPRHRRLHRRLAQLACERRSVAKSESRHQCRVCASRPMQRSITLGDAGVAANAFAARRQRRLSSGARGPAAARLGCRFRVSGVSARAPAASSPVPSRSTIELGKQPALSTAASHATELLLLSAHSPPTLCARVARSESSHAVRIVSLH